MKNKLMFWILMAVLVGLWITNPSNFDPACQGQDVQSHCVD